MIPQRCWSITPFIIKDEAKQSDTFNFPTEPVGAKPLGKNIFHIGRRSVPSIDRVPTPGIGSFPGRFKAENLYTQWYIVTGHFFITPPVIHAREYRIRKSSEHATIRSEARLFLSARFSSIPL